ncbi:thiolase family protein [Mycobacterium florentinum]|nr:thiolase family protein [Mycobacterium florentinum]
MATSASARAIDDAGLTVADIEGVCVCDGSRGLPGLSERGVRGLEQEFQIRPVWHWGGRTAGRLGALVDAMLAVAAGMCRHVLCVSVSTDAPAPRHSHHAAASGFGHRSTEALWAARASADYLARFGYSHAALGWVAIASRRHAVRNPAAVVRASLSMDEYLSAPIVCAPLRQRDFAAHRPDATAVIVSAASGTATRPVWVEALGARQPAHAGTPFDFPGYLDGFRPASKQMWDRTSLTPGEVDFAAIDDSSTFNVLCWLEALEFCRRGKGGAFTQCASRIGPDGELPINPDGGGLAGAGGSALSRIREAILQLRGQAGRRQIPNARIAVVASGTFDSNSALIVRTGGG